MQTGGADTVGVSTAYAVRSSEAAVKLAIRSARASSELKYQILILAVAVRWRVLRDFCHIQRGISTAQRNLGGCLFLILEALLLWIWRIHWFQIAFSKDRVPSPWEEIPIFQRKHLLGNHLCWTPWDDSSEESEQGFSQCGYCKLESVERRRKHDSQGGAHVPAHRVAVDCLPVAEQLEQLGVPPG